MLKIRLMRIGAKKKPFYRVVAVDERAKRTGGYIEALGTYNPLTEPKDIKLNQDRIDHWVKQGAQMSTGFLRIIGKAPQRPPRKPKKSKQSLPPADAEGKQGTVDSGQVKTAEQAQPAAEQPTETPVSETPTAEEAPKKETSVEETKSSEPESQKTDSSETPAETPVVEEAAESQPEKSDKPTTQEKETKDEGSA